MRAFSFVPRALARVPSAAAACLAALAAASCAPPPGPHAHDHEPDGPEPVGEAVFALTVAEAVSNGCSTASVEGLSLQIVAQGACIAPGSFVEVPEGGNLTFTDPVLPYLEQPAKDALLAALADNPGTAMQVNSMLRTVAQQYLLHQWYQNGQCGIGLAATPGNSNHETGLALDVQQYDTWKSALTAHGFKWYGDADPVHFDYVGPGAVDYKGVDVLAFQVLWNKNHPEDLIDEDGIYGPQTGARLSQSPAEGFPIGPDPDCAGQGPAPDIHPALAFVGAADDLADGASAGRTDLFVGDHGAVEVLLSNEGTAPATNVEIGVEVPEPYLAVLDYHIETDFGHPGIFVENDANTDPSNPAHGSPLGASFSLKLNAFSKGETKRVTLGLRAESYSIEEGVAPEVRFWVKDVPGAYHQDEYGGPADNRNGSQTFDGGVLQIAAPADVYSRTQWLWDTDRREGWEPVGAAEVAAVPEEGFLSVKGLQAGPRVQSPLLSLSAEALEYIEIAARRPTAGQAYLYFATDEAGTLDPARRIALDVPGGSAFQTTFADASEHPDWTGTITRLGLGVDAGQAIEVDALRLVSEPGSGGEGGGGAGGGGAGGGSSVRCSCGVPGASAPGGAPFALAAALALLGLRRRRGR